MKCVWSGLLVVLSMVSGCAFTPSGKIEEAIKSNKGVVISPVFSAGAVLWVRQGFPDQRFMMLDEAEVRGSIGQAYQMAVVEPGTYQLVAATAYAGAGRSDPKPLTGHVVFGPAGQLKLTNRSYSEPYIAKVWKDRIVQRVVVPGSSFCSSMGPYGDCRNWIQNPSTWYDQVVQAEGWYDEKRFRPAINVVDLLMDFSEGGLATMEIRPGEVLLINSLRALARDIGYNDQRCTPAQGGPAHACPLNSVRAELGFINLGFFKEVATGSGFGKLDPALVERVRPYALKPAGKVVGQSNDELPLYEFRGNGRVAQSVRAAGPPLRPRSITQAITEPPAPPAR